MNLKTFLNNAICWFSNIALLMRELIERVGDVKDLTDGTMKKLGLTETQAALLKRKHFD